MLTEKVKLKEQSHKLYLGDMCIPLKLHVIPNLHHQLIIGCDTLAQVDLFVNIKRNHVQIGCGKNAVTLPLNNEIEISTVATLSTEVKHGELTPDEIRQLQNLLDRFKILEAKNPKAPPTTHLVQHRIRINNQLPSPQNPRPFPPHKRQFISNSILEMEKAGIIRASSSPTAAAVVPVLKKDGEFRLAIDYRPLNAITIRDAYPLPRIDTMLSILGRNRYFSTLDLASGYWQIPIHPDDRYLTAFVTEDGLFEFNVMPFGLCNAPATFQRLMDLVLKGIKWKKCAVYIDDIIIFSNTFHQHLVDLEDVFQRLLNAGLSLKIVKCHFARNQLPFLGFVATRDGIQTDKNKIIIIQNWKTPTTRNEVESFLGLAGFYRHFIKNFALIAEPLNRLKRKDQPFIWNDDQIKSFNLIKEKLIETPVLRYPDFTNEMEIHTDASMIGLGAVLAQRDENGKPYPLFYASRSLADSEKRYGITELEALADSMGS